MAVKTKEELLTAIRAKVGEDSGDETLTLIEDISDTIDSMNNNDKENWKQKYEDNDAAWRQKYRDRFFSATGDDDDEEEFEEKALTYDELFKEE